MIQRVEMTHEEKVKMYKKLKKKELIVMLIEANKQLANRQPTLEFQTYYSINPTEFVKGDNNIYFIKP